MKTFCVRYCTLAIGDGLMFRYSGPMRNSSRVTTAIGDLGKSFTFRVTMAVQATTSLEAIAPQRILAIPAKRESPRASSFH